MPIIPASWTGYDTVNAIGLGGGSSGGSTSFAYAKSLNITITELDTFVDLIGVSSESIGRGFSLDLISGTAQLFWKQLDGSYILIFKDDLNFGSIFVDFTLGQLGLAVKCSEITELFLVLRWDKNIVFDFYDPTTLSIPDLISVIDNVVYIDETQGSVATDSVSCTAYFPDDIGEVVGGWEGMYLDGLTDSQPFYIMTVSYTPGYTLTYIYPTSNNPYTFNINPWYLNPAIFKMSKQISDNDPVYQNVNIVSYDKVNNVFVLGLN